MLTYGTMSVAEIAALPVRDLAEHDAALFVWTTQRYLDDAGRIARVWGFAPARLLTWAKSPTGFSIGGTFGSASEFVVYARRGRNIATERTNRDWWNWPRGEHSAKPEAFLDVVEQTHPGPYAELFARRARLGWDYPLGDEALRTTEMPLARQLTRCMGCDGPKRTLGSVHRRRASRASTGALREGARRGTRIDRATADGRGIAGTSGASRCLTWAKAGVHLKPRKCGWDRCSGRSAQSRPSRTSLDRNHYLGRAERGFAWSDEFGVLVPPTPPRGCSRPNGSSSSAGVSSARPTAAASNGRASLDGSRRSGPT